MIKILMVINFLFAFPFQPISLKAVFKEKTEKKKARKGARDRQKETE
ncbi:hypothetical protein [Mucilaginibacter ginkgonis]|uniref:Uncharacterized protein n=1 Tax=Mucilaginibacter ginkgonis TaxID=2682091 RepID=A0A6I4HWQ2_9SPHI|nr:hypothetical protein [Mucilaginibacter ginkgonis]QQL49994.1 hypothetical protein GO620_000660 [Mucilaginibacter ginkgonis]